MSSKQFAGTDRFQLIRRLGEGGYGVVYEAFDRGRSSRVALKVLRHAEGRPLHQFKREFRALADIAHPNLVALAEFLKDDLHWFFTMELVHGVTIVDYARPFVEAATGTKSRARRRRLDEERLRRVLPQLADALITIHSNGIVHCDLKPSNVLVTEQGRVVVLDFGLVAEPGPHDKADSSWSSEEIAVFGTPVYMAPEQASSDRVTPAADWYSVGVMLYEMLTGRPPFSGSPFEVIEAKQRESPPPPTDLNPRAPRDLSALCVRLLDPSPGRRPSPREIVECVGRVDARPMLQADAAPVRDLLLGRETLLRALIDALDSSMRGTMTVVAVTGESGMGKSALVRHFWQAQSADKRDLLVLTSRCYECESMPYKALDPLVDAIAQHLQRLRDIEVARVLPLDIAILARLFPVLGAVAEVRRAPAPAIGTMDTQTVLQRAAPALRDLLAALALRMPVVLVIDDAQWGDEDSASMLDAVLRAPHPPPLLLVAIFRTEDVGNAALFRTLTASLGDASRARLQQLYVGRLDDEDARRLATTLLSGVDEAAARADEIARESGGNPFFIQELAHYVATASGPVRLKAALVDRIHALPESAGRLLNAVAVSAQSIPNDVARLAAGVPAEDVGALNELRSRRLIRASGDGFIETYHDRIRQTVVAELRGNELADWHRRLAAAWETSGLGHADTLVVHFVGAGDVVNTCKYAAIAAQNATDAFAFEHAARFYGLLVHLEQDASARRRWLVKLGDVLANTGRAHESAATLLEALHGAPAEEAFELESRATVELIRAGYLDEADSHLQRLLTHVGLESPAAPPVLAARDRRFQERAESEIPIDELRRLDVLTSVAVPLSMSSFVHGSAANTAAASYALRTGEPKRIAVALAGLAASIALGGTRTATRAMRLVAEAQRIAARLDDPLATGRTLLAEGIVLKAQGKWRSAVDTLETADAAFQRCTGMRWEREATQGHLDDAVQWTGEWDRFAQELPRRRHAVDHGGDVNPAAYMVARLSPLVHLAADDVDAARREADAARATAIAESEAHHPFALCTQLDIDLYSGDGRAAWERLEEAWPRLTTTLRVFQRARIEMRGYRARAALALAAGRDSTAFRRAEELAALLARERAPWADALAALVRATLTHHRGRADAARMELEAAETLLAQCDMHHYAAAARYRRGCLTRGAAGPLVAQSAVDWMTAHRFVNPVRFADLFAPGRW